MSELDSVDGLLNVLPALINIAEGLQNVNENSSKLAEIISSSDDASDALSSLAEGFISSTGVLQFLADANANEAEQIAAETDKKDSVFSIDLLDLDEGINKALNKEAKSENDFGDLFGRIIDGIGASRGFSGDLSPAVKAMEDVNAAKTFLLKVLKDIKGVSGAVFGLSCEVSGLTEGLKKGSAAFDDLIAAIRSKASDLAEQDFSGFISVFKELSRIQTDLAAALDGLITQVL